MNPVKSQKNQVLCCSLYAKDEVASLSKFDRKLNNQLIISDHPMWVGAISTRVKISVKRLRAAWRRQKAEGRRLLCSLRTRYANRWGFNPNWKGATWPLKRRRFQRWRSWGFRPLLPSVAPTPYGKGIKAFCLRTSAFPDKKPPNDGRN